jgi:VIT1/CCC1 family predicted Fe2+/Mn2+ transporter
MPASIPQATGATHRPTHHIREGSLSRLLLRETLMGAQDNLTNVLAVVLGVAVGSARTDLVALAGLAAALAEAISMGGVLYTATSAELDLDARAAAEAETAEVRGARRRLVPIQAAAVTFGSALLAGLIPLAPFAVLPLWPAVATSLVVSISALFLLGSWKARVTDRSWRRDGVQLVLIAGCAALAAALIGVVLRVQ